MNIGDNNKPLNFNIFKSEEPSLLPTMPLLNNTSSPFSPSNPNFKFYLFFGIVFIILLILFVLSLLGINVIGSISDGFTAIKNFFAPFINSISKALGFGELIKVTPLGNSKEKSTTQQQPDTSINSLQSNQMGYGAPTYNGPYQYGPPQPPPNWNPYYNYEQGDTECDIYDNTDLENALGDDDEDCEDVEDDSFTNPIQNPITSGKSNWCLVGEYEGKRGCIEVGKADKCLSGQIYPSKHKCVNSSVINALPLPESTTLGEE